MQNQNLWLFYSMIPAQPEDLHDVYSSSFLNTPPIPAGLVLPLAAPLTLYFNRPFFWQLPCYKRSSLFSSSKIDAANLNNFSCDLSDPQLATLTLIESSHRPLPPHDPFVIEIAFVSYFPNWPNDFLWCRLSLCSSSLLEWIPPRCPEQCCRAPLLTRLTLSILKLLNHTLMWNCILDSTWRLLHKFSLW